MTQDTLLTPTAFEHKGPFNLTKITPTENNAHKKQYKLGQKRGFQLAFFLQQWVAHGNPLLSDAEMANLLSWTVALQFEIRDANMQSAREAAGVGDPVGYVKRASPTKKAALASGGLTAIEAAQVRKQASALLDEIGTMGQACMDMGNKYNALASRFCDLIDSLPEAA